MASHAGRVLTIATTASGGQPPNYRLSISWHRPRVSVDSAGWLTRGATTLLLSAPALTAASPPAAASTSPSISLAHIHPRGKLYGVLRVRCIDRWLYKVLEGNNPRVFPSLFLVSLLMFSMLDKDPFFQPLLLY